MRRLFVLTLCLLPLLAACDGDGDDVSGPLPPEERLLGRWNWESTYNPWTGETTTPATEGTTRRYDFLDDGTYSHRTDGEVDQTGHYELEGTDGEWRLTLLRAGEWLLEDDTLTRDETPVDGPRVIYRKHAR